MRREPLRQFSHYADGCQPRCSAMRPLQSEKQRQQLLRPQSVFHTPHETAIAGGQCESPPLCPAHSQEVGALQIRLSHQTKPLVDVLLDAALGGRKVRAVIDAFCQVGGKSRRQVITIGDAIEIPQRAPVALSSTLEAPALLAVHGLAPIAPKSRFTSQGAQQLPYATVRWPLAVQLMAQALPGLLGVTPAVPSVFKVSGDGRQPGDLILDAPACSNRLPASLGQGGPA